MNCMKVYSSDITLEGYLRARDPISRGQPFIFWNYNLKENRWKMGSGRLAKETVGLELDGY